MRVIVYTGKGGVGKTSHSAAAGIAAARRGHNTLVVSTDTAHSLGDCFDMKLGGEEPRKIRNKLFGMEVDVVAEMERNYRHFLDYWAEVNEGAGYDKIVAKEIAVFPSMEEIVNLSVVRRYSKKFDVVIIDSGPTADTIRNLSFFSGLSHIIRSYANMERIASRTLRRFRSEMWGYPIPSDEFYRLWLQLIDENQSVERLLTDARVTSVRIVLTPERIVVQESERAFLYFNLLGLNVDAVVANRILPKKVDDAAYAGWKAEQARSLEEVKEVFGETPLLQASLQPDQVVGLKAIEQLADEVFRAHDPADILYSQKAIRFFDEKDHYLMRVSLPSATKAEVKVFRRGEEILIRAGKAERRIMLPWVLRGSEVVQAKMDQGALNIRFTRNSTGG
jgi:arsenite-transporting ATPase